MAKGKDDSTGFDGFNIESLPRWLRDFIDLQNEVAGREAGRIKRFLPEDRFEGPNSEKKKNERAFNALMRLLQDPHYARLYSEAVDVVTRADRAVSAALDEIARETDAARRRLEQLRQSAAELPDGTKVFLSDRDGHLYTEDGSIVDDRRAAASGLSESSPSWEEFSTARTRIDDLDDERQRIETYRRERIEPAKERLRDTDHPASEEELEEFKSMEGTLPPRGRKHLRAEEPGAAKSGAALKNSAADEIAGVYESPAPDVTGAFKTAHDDASSSATASPTTGPKYT